MTGCRVARGGAQDLYRLRPDLTCLGKIIGGGMPLALYGGRRDIMDCVSPIGPVYQAGTLSGNPVAVSAGLATLSLLDNEAYGILYRLGQQLEAGLHAQFTQHPMPGVVQRVGSRSPALRYARLQTSASANLRDCGRFARFHGGLLRRGIYWPPSQLEAAFI